MMQDTTGTGRGPSPSHDAEPPPLRVANLPKYLVLDRSQLAIIAAGSIWGSGTIIIRYLQHYGLEAMTIAFVRSLGAWALMLGWMLLRQRSDLKIARRDLPAILAMALAGPAMSQPLFIRCVTLTSVAVATILNYTSPVFASIIARIAYGEMFTTRKIVALIMTFLGLGFVADAWKSVLAGGAGITPASLAMGLGSGFCYALYTVALKSIASRYHPMTIQVWNMGIGLPVLFLYALLDGFGSVDLAPQVWWLIALNSLGPGFVAFLLFTWGMNRVQASHAPLLASAEPITASFLGLLILKEKLTASQYLGITLMLGGIAAISGNAKAISSGGVTARGGRSAQPTA